MNLLKRIVIGYLQSFNFFGAILVLGFIIGVWCVNNYAITPAFDTTTTVWQRTCSVEFDKVTSDRPKRNSADAILICNGDKFVRPLPSAVLVELIQQGGRLEASCSKHLRMPSDETSVDCEITVAR